MHSANRFRRQQRSGRSLRATLGLVAVLAGCGSSQPATAPTTATGATGANAGISLRTNWQATVVVERDDSIVLTLPSGDHQLQRMQRRGVFHLAVKEDGKITLRLDSLTVHPRLHSDTASPAHAAWSGRLGDARPGALHVSDGGDGAGELTAMVRDLLPRLPAGGAHAQSSWSDTSSGSVQVDIFNTSERRTGRWRASALTAVSANGVLPIHVREEFEQLGNGTSGDKRLTMTSQGRRSATYYVTRDGRVRNAQLEDSTAMLISIPSTRQVVPTIRFAHTNVRFIALPGDSTE